MSLMLIKDIFVSNSLQIDNLLLKKIIDWSMLIKLLSTLFLAALDQFLCVACAHPLSLIEYFECNFVLWD